MKPWIWLRVASFLQALGTVGHTMASFAFPGRGPGEESVFNVMRSYRFNIMGLTRSHWDFYNGYELSITVTFAFLAVLMWQLSSLSRTAPEHALPLIVTVLVCEIFMSIIGWEYFFAGPGGMSILIAVCLVAALLTLRRGDQASLATRVESKAS
jgi:hypothetical protein